MPSLFPHFRRCAAAMLLVAAMAPEGAPVALAQNPPPPPAESEDAIWYYAVRGQSEGPLSLSQLREAAHAGKVRLDTQVYHPKAGWRFAKDVPELAGFFAAVNAAAPPAPPPPPPSQQQSYDEAAKSYLLGTWRSNANSNIAGRDFQSVAEVTYRSDGTYAGSLATEMPGSGLGPVATPLRGSWSLTAQDEAHFTLTTMPDNSMSSSAMLTVIDRNTVQDSAGAKAYRVR